MHPYLKAGLIALAAYGTVALFQTKVMTIPLVGGFLPGGLLTPTVRQG